MYESVMQWMWNSVYLFGGNVVYVEEFYEFYLYDFNVVLEEWCMYFQKFFVDGNFVFDVLYFIVCDYFVLLVKNQCCVQLVFVGSVSSEYEKKQVEVFCFIYVYCFCGYQVFIFDLFGLWQCFVFVDLLIDYYGLMGVDLDIIFCIGEFYIGKEEVILCEIVDSLKSIYCGIFGVEFMYIVDFEQCKWFFQCLESVCGCFGFFVEVCVYLFECLIVVEGLEKYLGIKYLGIKCFGLEGGESLILMVDEIIQCCGFYGVKEIVIGMVYCGCLNVLVNILGKNLCDLFDEFEGKKMVELGFGDVKYYQGFFLNVMISGGEVYLVLVFNLLYLEIVFLVVEGFVCVCQDCCKDSFGDKVVLIFIYGDVVFVGQGVVMEIFQMLQICVYKIGGIIYLVINNQVGFIISCQDDVCFIEYVIDVVKMIQVLIFYVNGDDFEVVLFVIQLVVDYCMQFKCDVVIDLVCYCCCGYNEVDELSGIQLLMYQQIVKQCIICELYVDVLVNVGVFSVEQVQLKIDDYCDVFDNGLYVVKSLVKEFNKELFVDWCLYLGYVWIVCYDICFDLKILQELFSKMLEVLEGFVVQCQVLKIYEDCQKMVVGGLLINWGFVEILVYVILLFEGYLVWMIGQDVGCGIFLYCYVVLYNQKDDLVYVLLVNLFDGQLCLDIYDFFFLEEVVLVFEYGFVIIMLNLLVIWEVQFGDFVNGVQVVIDQFIISGESKWG